MNKKELIELGIAEDLAEKIIILHGKDIEGHKTKLTTAETELTAAKAQITEANKQIDAFKGMNIDQIKASADEWKTKAEQAQAEAVKQVAQLKFDHALDGALTGAKAKNAKAVKALLEMANLKLNEADGSIIGLDDQLKKVKEGNDYLFEGETTDPQIVIKGNNQSVLGDKVVDAARKAAGLPISTQGK